MKVRYSLVIEATRDPCFFGFFSPDLGGFTGIGYSLEDCFRKAKEGMKDHLALMKREKLPIPKPPATPTITIPVTHPQSGQTGTLSAKVRPTVWSLKGILRAMKMPGTRITLTQRGKTSQGLEFVAKVVAGPSLAGLAEQWLGLARETHAQPARSRRAKRPRSDRQWREMEAQLLPWSSLASRWKITAVQRTSAKATAV